MEVRDGSFAPVIRGTVGSGNVTRGDMCVLSSNTFVRIANGASVLTVVAIAMESAVAAAVAKFQLVSNQPIIRARYTGVSKTSLTDADISKVYDISTSAIIDLDDTSGGFAFCVGYDNDLDTIDFIVIPAQRTL